MRRYMKFLYDYIRETKKLLNGYDIKDVEVRKVFTDMMSFCREIIEIAEEKGVNPYKLYHPQVD